jgi:hypothetical protein
MSAMTRAGMLGRGVALAAAAAGGGVAGAAVAEKTTRRTLSFEIPSLRADAPRPAFGTLVSERVTAPLVGTLVGADGVDAGRFSDAPLGELRVRTLELEDGAIVALGSGSGTAVTGGTGVYAHAAGHITMTSSAAAGGGTRAVIDVELDL